MSHSGTGERDDPCQDRVFMCDGDGCNADFEEYGTFIEVWAEAKKEGWIAFQDERGNWCHLCPDCKGKPR